VTDLADHDEIITHKLKTGSSDVLVLTLSPTLSVHSSFTVPVENTSLRVSLLDVTGDDIEEIATLPRNLPLNRIDFHNDSGTVVATSPLSAPITGTVDLLKTSNDSATILHDAQDLGDRGAQRIVVDISEQRLTAYENDVAVHTFLISSGTYSFPTPLGSTTVTAKIPVHRYTWSYGPNNPNNYDLPGVKWNLRFRQNYYIHSAYWHNSFGRRMSHGCINVDMKNAEWIYNWAEVGAVVDIIP
jgi:lipoprotein-anchoring transpeptidase ErfK/SrfK